MGGLERTAKLALFFFYIYCNKKTVNFEDMSEVE
jgi:hypothetical protein